MPQVEAQWKYVDGGYIRTDGTRLVRNKYSGGTSWWVHVIGHDTPLQLRGQPHLRRSWRTAVAAMQAANKEYPPRGIIASESTKKRMRTAEISQKKKPARKQATSRRVSRRPRGLTKNDPFVFIGHGFGTSSTCLECYLWFDRAPDVRRRRAIASLLPKPVSVFARFRGEFLHFGSDDALEERIRAAYAKAPATRTDNEPVPTRQEWRRFCDDFDRAVRAIDRMCKLVAVVKPDDGTYGKRLSPWHKRSMADATRLVARAAAHTQGREVASLAMNLLEDVLPTWNATMRLDDASRQAWLRWLDALIAKCRTDPDLTSEFVERAAWLYGTAPVEQRGALLASMRQGAQKRILAKAQLWKQ